VGAHVTRTDGPATAEDYVRAVTWVAIVGVVVGAVTLLLSFHAAHRPAIPALEQRVFRTVNGFPDWCYWPLWVPMQLGNLVVGTLAGLAVAGHYRSWTMAAAAIFAACTKLLAERVVRHWTRPLLAVRQRPGTSEPGARLRGRDVPASGPSFPSGHVILAVAMACIVSVEIPGAWTWVPFLLAFVVMFGRVYVGAHNPLDVTAGLGLGLVIGSLVAALFV
jgi:undecaprenyl-diphosphatase